MTPKSASKGRRGEEGFTFIEVILVIAILGVLAAMGTGILLREMPNYHLQDASRTLLSDIQTARLYAVRSGTTCTLEQFPANGDSYRIRQNGIVLKSVLLPKDVFFGSLDATAPAPDSGTFSGDSLVAQPTGLTSSGSFYLKCSNSSYGSEVRVTSLGKPGIRKWNGSSYN